MKLNLLKTIAMVTVVGTFFTACTPKDVTVYQQEDQLLNCKKLTAKLAELMHTNSEVNENTGLEKSSLSLWLIHPVAGALNQIDASSARDKIDERFLYLLKLKQRQNCSFTDKEIAFSKLQGKGRFSEDFEKWMIEYDKKVKEWGHQ
jgi:hypothetical protein